MAFACSLFMLRRKKFRFRRGQRVVIASGTLAGLAATVQSYCAKGRLTLAVDAFTRGALIRISERHVRPILAKGNKGST
jgi:transcription antitermination factor NusG